MFTFNRTYSLRKSRQILKSSYKLYGKNGSRLSSDDLKLFESKMELLDQALLEKDRKKADEPAKFLEKFTAERFKKSVLGYVTELVIALVFAFFIAVIIRQVWFELYEIPSGSMRPTFKEQDRLTVTKTAFGINVPLMTKHFLFEPGDVQRTSVVIWSGDNIPYLDSDSVFMGVFPYTKRYIKRLMGKPGDSLYFYGGKIYGFDKDGNDLSELRDAPELKNLDHVPFLRYEGRAAYNQDALRMSNAQVTFNHFNLPVGRINFGGGNIRGEIFNGTDWVKDQPDAQNKPHDAIKTYSDFFGMRNYAMARLLTKKQVEALGSYNLHGMEEGILYLELRHTPSLQYPEPFIERFGVFLPGYSTLIPLQERHLKALMDNMYTARFVVKDNKATRYHQEGAITFSPDSPLFPKVPDGTYEFYFGKAFEIKHGGIAYLLPSDHPLYKATPANIQKLYNTGIEISTRVSPASGSPIFFPGRYAYFRDGDLYLLGAPIFKKDDPVLLDFNKRESKKEDGSATSRPYAAFKDYGPPLTSEGKLNKDFIGTFGYKVPENTYLVLGDNHAMSQDSRYVGSIPQANLQGAPSLIFWPPGDRWGVPNQKPYPLFTLPRLIVWSVFGIIAVVAYALYRKNLRRPIFKKIDFRK